MTAGTPGFVAERLRDARVAKEIPQQTLADLVGRSRQMVSRYESGLATPGPQTLGRITRVLNLPPRYFLAELPTSVRSSALYRSLAATTLGQKEREEVWTSWLTEIVGQLERLVILPRVNVPDLCGRSDPLEMRQQDVEEAAVWLRDHWGLGRGPIAHVCRLLESNGAVVHRLEMPDRHIDGHSSWMISDASDPPRPVVVVNGNREAAARERFSLAHELGHLVLHRSLRRHAFRMEKQQLRTLEQQAHWFAGAFLLPAEEFAKSCKNATLSSLRVLKGRWKVSIGAMIERAHQLDFLTDQARQRFWMLYSARGWKRREPLDDELTAERPALLRKAIKAVIDSGVRTGEQLVAESPFPHDVWERLCALEPGTLINEPEVQLREHRQLRDEKVVPFPGSGPGRRS